MLNKRRIGVSDLRGLNKQALRELNEILIAGPESRPDECVAVIPYAEYLRTQQELVAALLTLKMHNEQLEEIRQAGLWQLGLPLV